ncbi:MAG: hypothetical protein ACD_3C00101G0006 [uncultured bacterium (gcode 4)]|uniref:Uncharacterized protein n=1 Tax=uncultured bacterium (gcode 4) TaxID=1234023 RepID=K2GXH6_9BACT|nr:MAG: hypothetical protein ACD_3C00101G0006 [uncultured bacterium (gcode 4)]
MSTNIPEAQKEFSVKKIIELKPEDATNAKVLEIIEAELRRLFNLALSLSPETKINNFVVKKIEFENGWISIVNYEEGIIKIEIVRDDHDTDKTIFTVYHPEKNLSYVQYSIWKRSSIVHASRNPSRSPSFTTSDFKADKKVYNFLSEIKWKCKMLDHNQDTDFQEAPITQELLSEIQMTLDEAEGLIAANNKRLKANIVDTKKWVGSIIR